MLRGRVPRGRWGAYFALAKKPLPTALPFIKMIGPSFILLGLGLGSGEVILWPYLASNFGLGVVWGIVVGVTMQFFINMEVSRYALVHGESVFVGFARLIKWLPVWFILSTFLGFGWPGIGLGGAALLAAFLGVEQVRLVAIVLFVLIGVFLTMGKVLYKVVERLQKIIIAISVPFLLALTFYFVRSEHLIALGRGLLGVGEGYWLLPEGMAIGTFLGALAYAGAGGNLNLAQSFYVRDKGYGMGRYAERIGSLFRGGGGQKEVTLTGATFRLTENNLRQYRSWWRKMNLEHFVVFWCLGLLTMLMLALLAYATVFGMGNNTEGIAFVINEAGFVGGQAGWIVGAMFLLIMGVVLGATQLTVLDSTSRIMTENLLLLEKKRTKRVAVWYYLILWLQIFFGISVFLIGFDEPRQLITLGATINAFSMFVYTGLLLWLNQTLLPKEVRPNRFRILMMGLTFVFLGFFGAWLLKDMLVGFWG